MSPLSTRCRNACLVPSPLCAANCVRGSRQYIHQQPPVAPRGPKSCSRSCQRSAVSGWHSTSGIASDIHDIEVLLACDKNLRTPPLHVKGGRRREASGWRRDLETLDRHHYNHLYLKSELEYK